MKILKKSFAGCCLLALILTSCGKNHVKQLARTWQVSNIETTIALPDSVKTKMISDSQLVFTKDGRYSSSGEIGVDKGTYNLDKDGKFLTTISEVGKGNAVYTVDKLSDDELVITNNGNTVTYTAKNK